MSGSWSDVFADLDRPVLGDPVDYDTAESEADDLRVATESCVDEFARISSADGAGELQGQAARQLATLVSEVDGSLSEVPPVFTSLAGIFERHARDLRDIEVATTAALARARTRWSAVETAQDDAATASSALARIEAQTRQLHIAAVADPVAAMELPAAEQQEWTARSAAERAATTLQNAREDLDASRVEFNQLSTDETDLIDRTVREIGAIDLGALKDPNRLLQIVGSVVSWGGGLIADVVVGVYRAVEAALDGRFLDALWHLSDALDSALKILAVVVLVVAIVATGGSGLFLAGLVIGGVKLATDATLAHTQHPHPVTGQTRTWGEVAIDAALLAVTAATGGLGGRPTLGNRIAGIGTTGARGSVVMNLRQIINPVSAAGRPIYGAARNSSVQRATGAVVSTVIDDAALGLGGIALEPVIKGPVTAAPLTTDTTAWTHPSIVALANGHDSTTGGSSAASATQLIETSQIRVSDFPTSGPLSGVGAPVFQLADAE